MNEVRRLKVVWVTRWKPEAGHWGLPGDEFERLRLAVAHHDVHLISVELPPGEIAIQVGDTVIGAQGTNALFYPSDSPLYKNEWPRTPLRRAFHRLVRGPTDDPDDPGPEAPLPIDNPLRRGQLESVRHVLAKRLAFEEADLVHITGADLAPVATASTVPVALLLEKLISRSFEARPGEGWRRRLAWSVYRRRWRRWERQWLSHVGRSAIYQRRWERGDGRWHPYLDVDVGNNGPSTLSSLIERSESRLPDAPPEALLELWSLTVVDATRSARSTKRSHQRAGAASTAQQHGPTAVICTRERPDVLRQTLTEAAKALALAPGSSLVVVEQGEPSAATICAELGIEAAVVHDAGTGAAHARNLGARAAQGSIVLFCDDDCLVPSDWVNAHVGAFQDGEVVASFGPVQGLRRTTDQDDPVTWPARHRTGSPPWVIGHSANMAVSRDAFLAIGGFDERLGPGARGNFVCEDADLIVRLLRAGGAVAAGVGRPVHHIEWRSPKQHLRNLRAYERGSGAWIGKLARQDSSEALLYLRYRAWIVRDEMRQLSSGSAAVWGSLAVCSVLRGLGHGWRLGLWQPGAKVSDRSRRATSGSRP